VIANQRRSIRRRAALQEQLSREPAPAPEETTPELDAVHEALGRVTGAPDGIVRELAVKWETWTYAVAYSRLGEGAAVRAPANALPMGEWRR
jgi:hypothetical protein